MTISDIERLIHIDVKILPTGVIYIEATIKRHLQIAYTSSCRVAEAEEAFYSDTKSTTLFRDIELR